MELYALLTVPVEPYMVLSVKRKNKLKMQQNLARKPKNNYKVKNVWTYSAFEIFRPDISFNLRQNCNTVCFNSSGPSIRPVQPVDPSRPWGHLKIFRRAFPWYVYSPSANRKTVGKLTNAIVSLKHVSYLPIDFSYNRNPAIRSDHKVARGSKTKKNNRKATKH